MVTTTGTSTGAAGAETWVLLERKRQARDRPFGAWFMSRPTISTCIRNDTIYLYREPQTFLAFGAVGTQQQFPFGAWRLSLAEAISRAGGLVDVQANPSAVFLYRGEARDVAEAMGIDCTPTKAPSFL